MKHVCSGYLWCPCRASVSSGRPAGGCVWGGVAVWAALWSSDLFPRRLESCWPSPAAASRWTGVWVPCKDPPAGNGERSKPLETQRSGMSKVICLLKELFQDLLLLLEDRKIFSTTNSVLNVKMWFFTLLIGKTLWKRALANTGKPDHYPYPYCGSLLGGLS